MRFINAILRLFGLELVKETSAFQRDNDPFAEESWQDLQEHSPRYKLRKINK